MRINCSFLIILMFLLLATSRNCYSQDYGKPPYPIIFVHGWSDSDSCWTQTEGNWKNKFTNDYHWTYGGKIVSNCDIYGGLYQWNEMMQYTTIQGQQGICPDGWHLPSDGEWTNLIEYLGGGAVAGGKMKEAGTTHWQSPNTGATNSSGFTALPAGFRYDNGSSVGFGGIFTDASFRSSTQEISYPPFAWGRYLTSSSASVTRSTWPKYYGYSVRCVYNN